MLAITNIATPARLKGTPTWSFPNGLIIKNNSGSFVIKMDFNH
jgi:hypothetical protein